MTRYILAGCLVVDAQERAARDYNPNRHGVGLLRVDSGLFDGAILAVLEGKRIPYIVAASLTQLMSLFPQAVLRSCMQATLFTLHGLVLSIGASWQGDTRQHRLILSTACRKRAWLADLWSTASAPTVIQGLQNG